MKKKSQSLSLEQLENDYWGDAPLDSSYLVNACYRLRHTPIEELGIEDLRILIGQNIGLKYLIPIAFGILKENPFCEGDFFEGDLLLSVLSSDKDFWRNEMVLIKEMLRLIKKIEKKIKTLDSSDEIKNKLEKQLGAFQNSFLLIG